MRIGPRPAGALALLALALTSVASYHRVFDGPGWLLPALGAAVLPVLGVLGLRRAGVQRQAAGGVALVAGALYVFLMLRRGLGAAAPLADPLGPRELLAAIVRAGAALDETYTPAAPTVGLAGLLALALVPAAVVSAVSLGREGPPLAALPWIVVFGFAGAVGVPEGRLAPAVGFLVSLLALLYAEGWARAAGPALPGAPATFGGPPGLRTAAGTAAVVLVVALAAPSVTAGILEGGPRLGGDTDSQTVLSPIVQILPRLNDRTPRVLFTVDAERPAYWRLTALDRFDGDAWSASGEYRQADGRIGIDDPPGGGTARLRQRFTIQNLGGIWVPAAYAPAELSGIDATVDAVRGTIATDGLTRGQAYTVVSQVPDPDPDRLLVAGTRGAPEGSTDLPAGLPPVIGEIAREVVGRRSGAYDRALAVQRHLRTFEYRQDVPPGHSGDYLVHFLTDLRAGYCEQFAGSMAVLLRTLGIPARVAVGFLPGKAVAGGFVVDSQEAHAWTEVWFEGLGWVPFEPTPRAGVGPPSYAAPPSPAPAAPATPTPASPSASPGAPAPGASAPALSPPAAAAGGATGGGGIPGWVRTAFAVAAAVAGGLLLLMAARAVRLRAWTALRRPPADRISSAWRELTLRGADAWRPRRPAETEQEYARGLVGALGVPYPTALVAARQRAAYGTGPAAQSDADAAADVMRVLRRELFTRAGWPGRLRLLLSPRPLLRRSG